MEAHDHGHDHGNALKVYFGIFAGLGVATAIEALPLFHIVALPPLFLLVLSFVKFVVVVLFFMHLFGDAKIFWQVFFIPLAMAGTTVSVLMMLFHTWTLSYQKVPGAHEGQAGVKCEKNEEGQENCYYTDNDTVAACYKARYHGDCAAWAISPFTHNEYCTSPINNIGEACQKLTTANATIAAYEALKKPASDPRFDGFSAKNADEQKAVLLAVGKEVFEGNCAACHGPEGTGVASLAPPLKADPVANGPAEDHIKIVLNGLSGKAINGVTFSGAMPGWARFSDDELASVMTYERSSWDNKGTVVTPEQVKELR